MASTRSLLRIFVVPLMPMDDATPLSSSSFMAARPDTGRVVVSDTKDPSPSFAARRRVRGAELGPVVSGRLSTTSAHCTERQKELPQRGGGAPACVNAASGALPRYH